MENKILIVDDEPDIVDLISYNLKKDGFRVTTASDGEEALSKIRKSKFDLVVLDLMLPGEDGLTLCRKLRGEADTPVIMLTAVTGESLVEECAHLGISGYLVKPFPLSELAAQIDAAF